MQTMRVFVIVLTLVFAKGLRLPQNNTAVLISKYAKVAKWGTTNNNTSKETGRSYTTNWRGRSSSDSDSVNNQIVYQYPVYQKSSEKADDADVEIVPGIGEVIQDRFQVRPYFGYGNRVKDTSITYLPPVSPAVVSPTSSPQASPPAAAPAIQIPPLAPTPQISVPTFSASDFNAPALSSATPPPNLYNSPFTSYNPPSNPNQDMPDTNQDPFPPNKQQTNDGTDSFSSFEDSYASAPISGNAYASAPISGNGPYNYQPAPKQQIKVPNEGHMVHNNFHQEVEPPSNMYGVAGHGNPRSPQGLDTYEAPNHGESGPPKHPPKSIDDVYYPPDFPKEQVHASQDDAMMEMTAHGGHDDEKGHNIDFSPPANYDFPKYLYDDHHYDHHVFEEVHHKTTTPAPEKKRVSTTQYSYYYLGRKLWYIPLYFSIYFMIYVTALIIKSIARHKVTLRNEWVSANSRRGRDLTVDHIEAIEEVHKNITAAIDKADKLYSHLVM